MQSSIAEVILDDAIDRPLDYAIPDFLAHLQVGMRVEVPLKGRMSKGTIFALKEKSLFSNLKSISKALSKEVLVCPDLFELALWITKYYCAPLSKVLKTILPPSLRDETNTHKTQKFIQPLLSKNQLKKMCENLRQKNPSQAKILDLLLKSPKGLFLSEILERESLSTSPIHTLAKKKVLRISDIQIDRSMPFDHEFFPTKPKKLTEEQEKALNHILETCKTFQTHLLYGITGSGKTEIYFQAMEHILQLGQGILFLVPEIALTSQTIERIRGRFGKETIAVLHHRLSHGERFDGWHNIRTGKAKIVIGARSAIFCPISSLGLIIVDEEHEASYKQTEESPKYNARDLAIVRGKFAKCPVLLGSATPSMESYANALKGKYQLHTLTKRPDAAHLPKVSIINMQTEYEKAQGFTLFSPTLIDKIKSRLKVGEQILLFLNRRGYHTQAQCNQCPYVVQCPHCDLSLTYHLGEKTLACHLCNYRTAPPRSCPKCQAEGPLKYRGVGTEMVQKALHALFPEVRTLRLDADTTRHKGSHDKIFKAFRSGKADVLIGTQMIAKGLHFPLVTLVGILGCDGSLNIPDFRASEKVFQLITQVSGRAGRGEIPGEVVIQTNLPDHPTIQWGAKQDFPSFYAEEIEVRKFFGFPPFSHLIKFSFSGKDCEKCEKQAQIFRKNLVAQLSKEVEIYPVIPCGYAKIKGNYRFQFLVKTQSVLSFSLAQTKLKTLHNKAAFSLSVDVDPVSTFF